MRTEEINLIEVEFAYLFRDFRNELPGDLWLNFLEMNFFGESVIAIEDLTSNISEFDIKITADFKARISEILSKYKIADTDVENIEVLEI